MPIRHLSIRVPRGAPGDTVAVSALVRDLALLRPETRVSVVGPFADDLFRYDPRVAVGEPPDAVPVTVAWRAALAASATDRTRRYVGAAHACYRAQTGDPLRLTECRPSLTLGPAERARPDPLPYAVVAAGSKSDIPLKQAPPGLFDAVVRQTADLRWKQVGRTAPGRLRHRQRPIPGAEDLLGRTDLRALVRLIAHARVVLCHVSLPMLVAAAFRVPCVVLAGGREDPWYHACPGVTYLHTVGRLACCLTAGCRALFPRAGHPGEYPPGTLCVDPVEAGGVWVGRCMTLHPADAVVAAVRAAAAGRTPLPVAKSPPAGRHHEASTGPPSGPETLPVTTRDCR